MSDYQTVLYKIIGRRMDEALPCKYTPGYVFTAQPWNLKMRLQGRGELCQLYWTSVMEMPRENDSNFNIPFTQVRSAIRQRFSSPPALPTWKVRPRVQLSDNLSDQLLKLKLLKQVVSCVRWSFSLQHLFSFLSYENCSVLPISLCFSLQFVTSPRLFSETFLGPFTQRQEGTRTLGPSLPRNERQARGNRTLLTFLVTAGSR